VPDGFAKLASFFGGTTGVIPVALPIVLAIALGAAVVLRRMRTGTHILSIGSDRAVARLCGVRITRTLVLTYSISALLAALAGVFLTARTLGGDPSGGASLTLDSLAVVVLGGTVLGGGRATVFGTVVAAFAIGLLSNVMNLLRVQDYWQTPAKGAVVIAAVLIPALSSMAVTAVRRRRAAGRPAAAEPLAAEGVAG
jgi:ribose/xylose/arabinose/galactoside ABC-type transport system permease subunit